MANLSYDWDTVGNLASRTDTLQGYVENFCGVYPPAAPGAGRGNGLNRLTSYAVDQIGGGDCNTGTIEKSMGYDKGGIGDGNISTKSDLGGYRYGQNGAGPHAVTSIDTSATGGCTLASCKLDGLSSPNFYYDANGNMTCVTTAAQCDASAARNYGYTSFNMAASVSSGTNVTTLAYTPEHARGMLTNGDATLYYFSNPAAGVTNEMMVGSTPTWRTYLRADDGHIVAEFFATGGTTTQYYFVGDHLASTTALTDSTGTGREYDSYDAWGKRRNPNGNDENGCTSLHPQSSKTLRGYTGQEEMDGYCLVNLNARLYDPAIGRMLSADPTVPGPLNGQAFNRYSYVTNNPLSFTDPSGYIAVYGETVHIYCVNGCGANGSDRSESMIDTEGTGGGQSLAEIFGGLFGAPGTGDGTDFAGMQFAQADTGYMTDAGSITAPNLDPGTSSGCVNSPVECIVVTAPALHDLAQFEMANASMNVDAYGEQFIKGNEGFGRTIYDSNGKGDWTIGWGHAVRGSEHQIYDTAVLTDQQAEELFQSDLNVAETAVRNNIQYSLTQNQFDALTDLAFNVGGSAFANSYTVSLLNSYSSFGDLMYAEGIWGGAFGSPGRRGLEIDLYNGPGE
ncbi:MAG TPA: RHS repeat-associated core domain-containing protein [Rhizomicrobium sp.]